jgi:DNA (cytosine-5)-methyltransferase 1
VLGAADVGAPHLRKRIWIVANDPQHGRRARRARRSNPGGSRQSEQLLSVVADTKSERGQQIARSLYADAGKAIEEPGGHQFVECRSKTVANAGSEGHGKDAGCAHGDETANAGRAALQADQSGRDGQWNRARDVADTHRMRELQQEGRKPDQRGWTGNIGKPIPNADETGSQGRGELEQPPAAGQAPARIGYDPLRCGGADWWQSEPDVGRVAHGVAARVDRLKAIGNGQVPQCAAMAFTLMADD